MGVPASDTSSATSTTTHTRLKRENFRRTKHDSAFSQWKILIGAFDWEEHSLGKEGVEKYRTQNLPNRTSCPGVYELGIAISRSQSGRETRKMNSSSIVPVYLGQADNLRTRLQQYGRDGAHLENGCLNFEIADGQIVSSHKGLGLFTNIFSRGLPIVYRCAPMKSKMDAEITEKQLLDKFDYAWNKGSNGARRQHDISKILDHLEKSSQFSLLAEKFLLSIQREVGIKIRTSYNLSNTDNHTTFSRILGIRRLQTRPEQYDSGDNCKDICGVSIGHGSICTTPPAAGRKRCAMHKGLRVNGYTPELNTEGKAPPIGITPNLFFSDFQDQKVTNSRVTHHPSEHALTCGFVLEDDSFCAKKPVKGNKRCLEHKGRRVPKSNLCLQRKKENSPKNAEIHIGLRVNGYIPELNTEGKAPPVGITPNLFFSDFQDQKVTNSRVTHLPSEHALTCGFILEDDSPCAKKPVKGNKRCLEHKGRRVTKSNLSLQGKKVNSPKNAEIHKGLRVNGYIPEMNTEGKAHHIGITPDLFFSDFQDQKVTNSRVTHHPSEHALTCGFILEDGSPCAKKPVKGNKRCLEHKGRRVRKST